MRVEGAVSCSGLFFSVTKCKIKHVNAVFMEIHVFILKSRLYITQIYCVGKI